MEIKKCPFCGRDPELVTIALANQRDYFIKCKCGVECRIYTDKYNAIKAWNRRVNEAD